jgi:protein gp37
MARTSIDWTEMSWNPCTGCTKISPGCANCYAELMATRLKAMGMKKYRNGFKLTIHSDALQIPYTWKTPKRVFVNSMSDIFHADVPVSFAREVFRVMNENSRHVFQVLTKRADILYSRDPVFNWSPDIWMGVTVESRETLHRIEYLKKNFRQNKIRIVRTLLGPLRTLDLKGINWVIVGGESGRRSRSMKAEWVMDIREQCREAGVPFFFKQWGGKSKKKSGHSLNGRLYREMPQPLAA